MPALPESRNRIANFVDLRTLCILFAWIWVCFRGYRKLNGCNTPLSTTRENTSTNERTPTMCSSCLTTIFVVSAALMRWNVLFGTRTRPPDSVFFFFHELSLITRLWFALQETTFYFTEKVNGKIISECSQINNVIYDVAAAFSRLWQELAPASASSREFENMFFECFVYVASGAGMIRAQKKLMLKRRTKAWMGHNIIAGRKHIDKMKAERSGVVNPFSFVKDGVIP